MRLCRLKNMSVSILVSMKLLKKESVHKELKLTVVLSKQKKIKIEEAVFLECTGRCLNAIEIVQG